MAGQDWIHLFTSNVRELYLADAIDIMGGPSGLVYRFRYHQEHVDELLRDDWNRDVLKAQRVAVHLSIQHPANFFSAAYVPIRKGRVKNTGVEGQTYWIDFALGEYLTLKAGASGEMGAPEVRCFSKKLRAILGTSFPDYTGNGAPDDLKKRRSASLGRFPVGELSVAGGAGDKFEACVKVISKAIVSEPPRIFFRVAAVKDENGKVVNLSSRGILELTAGSRYSLEVSHYQPNQPIPGTALNVTVPKAVELLGEGTLDLRSRYDVIEVPLWVPFRDTTAEGQVVIQVREPSRGTAVRLPIRVAPSKTHRFAGPGLGVVGAGLVAAPSWMGAAGNMNWKIVLGALGAVLVGLGIASRRSKGLGS